MIVLNFRDNMGLGNVSMTMGITNNRERTPTTVEEIIANRRQIDNFRPN